MLSLQSDPRQQYQQQQLLISRVSNDGVTLGDPRTDSSFPFYTESALSSVNIKSELSREVDEDTLLTLAHQNYKGGNYKQALEHSKAVYERNPQRTDNLLLLGAIYYQLHDFDTCIAKK